MIQTARVDETALPRERIFEEAIRIFGQNGFSGTSMREIAEAAGVTKPAIYYHYGSKEELFRAVVHWCFERSMQTLEPAFQDRGDLRPRLKKLVRAHFACYRQQLDSMRLLYAVAFAPERGAPRIDLWKNERPHLELLTSVFQDALDDGQATDLEPEPFAMLLDGMMNIHLMGLIVLGWELKDEVADLIAETVADAIETRNRRAAVSAGGNDEN